MSQRGVNGIDGIVASSAGAARALARATVVLLGDVSLAHDVAGLAAAAGLSAPFVVAAVNNAGGRIFEQLPIAKLPGIEPDLPFWTTPPEVDFAHAAATFGHRYVRAESEGDLREALHRGLERAGCTVVEAIVAPSGAIEDNRRLWAEVDRGCAW